MSADQTSDAVSAGIRAPRAEEDQPYEDLSGREHPGRIHKSQIDSEIDKSEERGDDILRAVSGKCKDIHNEDHKEHSDDLHEPDILRTEPEREVVTDRSAEADRCKDRDRRFRSFLYELVLRLILLALHLFLGAVRLHYAHGSIELMHADKGNEENRRKEDRASEKDRRKGDRDQYDPADKSCHKHNKPPKIR